MNEDDDFALFRAQMGDVKPFCSDRADTGKKPRNTLQVQTRRKNATDALAGHIRVDGLSDQFVIDVDSEEFLLWCGTGIQRSQLQRLKSGQIPFEGTLDCHGMTVDQVRSTLHEFLDEALRLNIRCVRITHGKAARKDKKKPILKSHINTWLQQHGSILAFCSCLPKHGGTGSVYVLLRRNQFGDEDQ